MEDEDPAEPGPKNYQELREVLTSLKYPGCLVLRARVVDPAWRAWCASYRFEDKFGFDGLGHIPASGSLLHYQDICVEAMKTLVEAGLPVDSTDTDGFTALYIAAMSL